jgi:glycosyltransferase involved in cell wall biosynthesis
MPDQRRQILWCGASYGYGTDLMYFGPILAAFRARFPETLVTIDRAFPVEEYPDLPLLPVLSLRDPWRILRRRAGSGYRRSRRFPTPATLLRLYRAPADLFVLIEFTPLAIACFLLSRLRRRKALLLIECDPRFRGARGGFAEVSVKRFIARRASHVLVSNIEGAAYLHGTLGVRPDRLTVGPYLTSVPPPPPAQPSEGEEPEGRSRAVRFVFVGSVSELKGLHHLVDALATLGPECAGRWRLDVVGDGAALEAISCRVEAAGLSGSVVFHGAVPHTAVWGHYRDADVVVNPTLADYRSLASFEAVNAGKPAVLSCYDGAAAEVLRSGAQVQVVHPDDRAETARALRRYILDVPFREAASRAARTPPPEFSLTAIIDNLEAAVRSALSS